MQIGSKYATAVSSDYKESCKSKVVTSSVEVVDTGLALGAHGVGGPAEQRAEIEFGAGRVAQDGDGAIGRRSIAGHDIHRFASAVECPAEGGDGRFGLNTAFHFAGQSFGSAVRVPLFRTAHRLICQGEMCQNTTSQVKDDQNDVTFRAVVEPVQRGNVSDGSFSSLESQIPDFWRLPLISGLFGLSRRPRNEAAMKFAMEKATTALRVLANAARTKLRMIPCSAISSCLILLRDEWPDDQPSGHGLGITFLHTFQYFNGQSAFGSGCNGRHPSAGIFRI